MSSATTEPHPLVARLRERMEVDYLTQKQVAEALDVSPRTVSYWMTEGKTPQKRHLQLLASWLNGGQRDEVRA